MKPGLAILKEAGCDFPYTGAPFPHLDSLQVGRWSFRRTKKTLLCNWRLTVRVAALCSSETSVYTYLRTRCQTPEEQNLNCHRLLKSHVTQIQKGLRKHTCQCLHCCISKKQGVLHLQHFCFVCQDYYNYTSRNLKARLILKSTELNFAL